MHIAYAEDHGYLPVVDMLHYHTQYHNPEDINEINVWEKFLNNLCRSVLMIFQNQNM